MNIYEQIRKAFHGTNHTVTENVSNVRDEEPPVMYDEILDDGGYGKVIPSDYLRKPFLAAKVITNYPPTDTRQPVTYYPHAYTTNNNPFPRTLTGIVLDWLLSGFAHDYITSDTDLETAYQVFSQQIGVYGMAVDFNDFKTRFDYESEWIMSFTKLQMGSELAEYHEDDEVE